NWRSPSDSLLSLTSAAGKRTSIAYNTTIHPVVGAWLSPVFTLGMNGSIADQTRISGSTSATTATSYNSPSVSKSMNSEVWGGYGNLRVGFWERLYVTVGLRGEHSPGFGQAHKID